METAQSDRMIPGSDATPEDGSILRGVLADQVKDRLLQAILAGRYPAGSRIVETQVARDLGTSQAPVREALRGLEALGVVEILPFRGARVRRPTTAELLEAYVVRFELESLGARLGIPLMSDADLARLEEFCERMLQAAEAGDPHGVAIADASFHGAIVHLARNATLERVWRSLEPFSRTYITLVAPGADPLWTANLHAGIIDALRARDPERVVAALQRHFDDASAHLAGGWQDGQPPASGPAPRGRTRADR